MFSVDVQDILKELQCILTREDCYACADGPGPQRALEGVWKVRSDPLSRNAVLGLAVSTKQPNGPDIVVLIGNSDFSEPREVAL